MPGKVWEFYFAKPVGTLEHQRLLAGAKLYCLVTEAYGCKQLAYGCYAALPRVRFEPATYWSQAQMPYPLHHLATSWLGWTFPKWHILCGVGRKTFSHTIVFNILLTCVCLETANSQILWHCRSRLCEHCHIPLTFTRWRLRVVCRWGAKIMSSVLCVRCSHENRGRSRRSRKRLRRLSRGRSQASSSAVLPAWMIRNPTSRTE